MNGSETIKAYAIQVSAMEMTKNIAEFKRIVEKLGYLGVTPGYPYAYVLFRTNEDRVEAFKRLCNENVLKYVKSVKHVAYIPMPDKKGGK